MSDEPVATPLEVTSENLRAFTNQMEGYEDPTSEPAPEPSEVPTEKVEEVTAPVQAPSQAGQAEEFTLNEDEKVFVKELRGFKELQDLPFKTPLEWLKGHKSLQGEFTKLSTRVKPLERFLNKASSDPRFKQAVEQLEQFYENPELARAYQNQQNPSAPPDPRGYNLDDPQGFQQFQTDLASYQERVVDSRIQTRLAPLESQRMLEQRKWEFKQQFPEVDPESVLSRAEEISQVNPLVNIHKVLDYDNMKAKFATMESDIRAKVTKELTERMQTASQTKTPQGSTAKAEVNAAEVLQFIAKNGLTKAKVRWPNAERIFQMNTRE